MLQSGVQVSLARRVGKGRFGVARTKKRGEVRELLQIRK